MPTGAPGRWYPRERRIHHARATARRRAGYALCGLLTIPVLVLGVLWAVSGFGRGAVPVPAPAALASSQPSSSPSAPSLQGTVTAQPQACRPAGSPVCSASPIHAGLAQVPARHGPRHPAALRSSGAPSASPGPGRATSPAASGAASSLPPPASAPAAGAHGDSPSPSSGLSGSPADQVLGLINQARSAAGLPALSVSSGLEASASAHDRTMAAGCGLSHQCAGEPAIGARESAVGVTWTSAGENIGDGGPVAGTAAASAGMAVTLTQDMLNEQPPDDGHRLNILSATFTHIGIDVYRDSSGTVWMTQDFSS
jgi:uncharacterized protein YkwD